MTAINFVAATPTSNRVPNLDLLEELLVWSASLYSSVNRAQEIQLAPNAVPISIASVAATKAADNRNYVGILVYVPAVAEFDSTPLPSWKKVIELSSAIGHTNFDQDF